jgi:hypothetical protein
MGEGVATYRNAIWELWGHRVEDYPRQGGHADLLRECVDGSTGI